MAAATRPSRLAALALALIAASTGAAAATLQEAQRAFDHGDFGRARTVWRDLAAGGAAEAAFRLGLADDLGQGGPPDPAGAFRWYLEATRLGHATAQFNVGVMLDAGTGTPSSPLAAAVWYARAAAKGYARAQYNLALLYAEGDGLLPRNVALARAWMRLAAGSLPAAEGHLAGLDASAADAAAGALSAPLPLATATTPAARDGAVRDAEIVWTAPEQPPGTRFFVELVDLFRKGFDHAEYLDVSAAAVGLPAPGRYAWRVLTVDPAGHRYRASPWWSFASDAAADAAPDEDGPPPPRGRVKLRFGSADAKAKSFAAELAGDFARSGFLVDARTAGVERFARSGVSYFFDDDAPLARDVARVLPALEADDAVLAPPPDVSQPPGVVEVRLSGGAAS
ncbi:MAG: sel1 repeat family protein [Geminicoccaceae bacterium]|nr:sel1 repeat family protein [Geminicoccaceae bacterium]